MTSPDLRAPFPWYGGKSRVAPIVWRAFGDVAHYVEPFFGSGAVLLGRPGEPRTETVNDIDGFVVNFWRAIRSAPDAVAEHADWPVSEIDLHARHRWLVEQRAGLSELLRGDPDAHDPKVAGWWAWGLSQWIGSGWCASGGRQLPFLNTAGQGIHRKRPPRLGAGHRGCARCGDPVRSWFAALSQRLRSVRICSGDWSRVLTPSAIGQGFATVGVFLDPPYATGGEIYGREVGSLPEQVTAWALDAAGRDRRLRIALCGYDGDVDLPGWHAHAWSSGGAGEHRRHRERIWFSPSCLPIDLHHAAAQGRPQLDLEG